MKTFVTFVLACGMVWSAFGQLDVPDTLLTVGTTTVDGFGRPWVYTVWTPSQPELLAGNE
ncbi:MAG: hypothetical protein FJ405_01320 [Verrucomicrobia bacterium]|nr:hypothetical protein [Verrucomicrobiota bacterium]